VVVMVNFMSPLAMACQNIWSSVFWACVSVSFCHFDKIPKINNLKEDLFWLMGSEISVHGWLVPLLWACVEAEHMTESVWWSKAAHLLVGKKHTASVQGRDQRKNIPSKPCPQSPASFNYAPPSNTSLKPIKT
jgi:hypothetical protein